MLNEFSGADGMRPADAMALTVQSVEDVALGVKKFVLADRNGNPLPGFEAGSHIEIILPNGITRAYSLLNSPTETSRYVIAVHKSPDSAGGSLYMHEVLGAGDTVRAAPPRNNFELVETAAHACLIAGGIGITPILSMIHRLCQLGRSWELHYCARTREHAAFAGLLAELAKSSGNAVRFYFDLEPNGSRLDIGAVVAAACEGTHLYCCGPKAMLTNFEEATQALRDRAHVEYFEAKGPAAREGGFVVVLEKSGLTLTVPPGASILDVVGDAGVSVSSSCREGICGTCETRVVEGVPDHRDALLSDAEKQANRTMMICCSGSKSGRLVLDL